MTGGAASARLREAFASIEGARSLLESARDGLLAEFRRHELLDERGAAGKAPKASTGTPKRLRDAIRIERKSRGLSMGGLAEIVGVDRATIDRIENGRRGRPQPDNLGRILAVLEFTPDQTRDLLPKGDDRWTELVLRAYEGAALERVVSEFVKTRAPEVDAVGSGEHRALSGLIADLHARPFPGAGS